MAITMAAARLGAILGNIVFGLIVDVNCAIPILLVSGLLIGKNDKTGGTFYINVLSSVDVIIIYIFCFNFIP